MWYPNQPPKMERRAKMQILSLWTYLSQSPSFRSHYTFALNWFSTKILITSSNEIEFAVSDCTDKTAKSFNLLSDILERIFLIRFKHGKVAKNNCLLPMICKFLKLYRPENFKIMGFKSSFFFFRAHRLLWPLAPQKTHLSIRSSVSNCFSIRP